MNIPGEVTAEVTVISKTVALLIFTDCPNLVKAIALLLCLYGVHFLTLKQGNDI